MLKLLFASAGAAIVAAQDTAAAQPKPAARPATAVSTPTAAIPRVCRRYSNVVDVWGTTVDVGTCKGLCKQVAHPWLPSDVARQEAEKGGVRVCKPKHMTTQKVPYTKIEKCDCVERPVHELETDEDVDSKIRWERRGDSIFFDQQVEIKDEWRRCRRVPKTETVGEDGTGKPITIDVGQCIGQCPVVFQPPRLTINLTLTGDDDIRAVYIDGVDRTGALTNNAAWTTQDTVLQTVPRAPGTEHVIAVQARDTARSMQGLLATVAYDGAVQHVTGSGDWIASSTAPAAVGGLNWFQPGYDSSATFTAPTDCTNADHNNWGTFWPAALLGDGARWIWGPDNSCQVWQASTRTSWFLLKFTIAPIPETKCHPTVKTSSFVEVPAVRSCDCQCKYKKECKAPLVWNDNKCECECGIDAASCPAGTIFNADKCACENCGICNAKTEGECREKQCLYTFFPFSENKGKAGQCVWRDFNGDGKAECGCPRNQCQTPPAAKGEDTCKKTVCKSSADATADELCDFNPNRLPGSECDCPESQA